MARAKVTHSEDAVQITFNGDKRNPEPSTGVIQFPGGHIEVSRCSDGSYWAHVEVVDPTNIVGSRIDYSHGAQMELREIPEVPRATEIKHIAIRISNAVPRFDPDA